METIIKNFEEYAEVIKYTCPTRPVLGYDVFWVYGFSMGEITSSEKELETNELLVKNMLANREEGIASAYSWYGIKLYVSESVTTKGFDNPEEIESKKVVWDQRLKDVCKKYNWEYKQPQWIIASHIFGIYQDQIEKAKQIILEQNL